MVNDSWLENLPQTTITHLSSTGSYQCPLLMEMISTSTDHIKYFRFINCWMEKPKYMEIVKTCWEKEVAGTGMWRFHQKIKRLSNSLSRSFKNW